MIPSLKGIHLEPTNICTLKCPGCARTRFIEHWPQHWHNRSIDIAVLDRFLDIDLIDIPIKLCGNYGDPIYHPDLIGLVNALKKRKAELSIVTNGSYKTAGWWQSLTESLDSKDQIVFSIDGLPENFTQYRINADWSTIQTGIRTCVAAGIRCVWKCIPFQYNQHDLQAAKELSRDLGMSDFRINPSSRFDERTMVYQPSAHLISAVKDYQDEVKQGRTVEIEPQCGQGDQHFISAQGYYSPCCFVADHRFYYKTQFGKNKQLYDINQFTLSELLGAQQNLRFYQEIQTDAPQVCQYSCPKLGG